MKAENFPAFAVGAGAFFQPLIDVVVCRQTRVLTVIIAADPTSCTITGLCPTPTLPNCIFPWLVHSLGSDTIALPCTHVTVTIGVCIPPAKSISVKAGVWNSQRPNHSIKNLWLIK